MLGNLIFYFDIKDWLEAILFPHFNKPLIVKTIELSQLYSWMLFRDLNYRLPECAWWPLSFHRYISRLLSTCRCSLRKRSLKSHQGTNHTEHSSSNQQLHIYGDSSGWFQLSQAFLICYFNSCKQPCALSSHVLQELNLINQRLFCFLTVACWLFLSVLNERT